MAVDLPADRADAGVDDYAGCVLGALRDVGGPLVLVGHSIGGLTIPVVAARRAVALLVFLSALIPDPGRSVAEQQAADRPDMMTPAWRERYLPRHTVLPDGRTQWPSEATAEISAGLHGGGGRLGGGAAAPAGDAAAAGADPAGRVA